MKHIHAHPHTHTRTCTDVNPHTHTRTCTDVNPHTHTPISTPHQAYIDVAFSENEEFIAVLGALCDDVIACAVIFLVPAASVMSVILKWELTFFILDSRRVLHPAHQLVPFAFDLDLIECTVQSVSF